MRLTAKRTGLMNGNGYFTKTDEGVKAGQRHTKENDNFLDTDYMNVITYRENQKGETT